MAINGHHCTLKFKTQIVTPQIRSLLVLEVHFKICLTHSIFLFRTEVSIPTIKESTTTSIALIVI